MCTFCEVSVKFRELKNRKEKKERSFVKLKARGDQMKK